MEEIKKLYEEAFGKVPACTVRLAGAGGDRVYFRLYDEDGGSVIGVRGDSLRDNRAFAGLSGVFRASGVPVPEIYKVSADGMCYLEEDLGDVSLFSLLGSAEGEELVAQAMRSLARMQSLPRREWEGLAAYPAFSRRQVMWDLNYFKYEFLKPTGVAFDEDALEDDFERLADRLTGGRALQGFMYRDFQSRNVMVRDGNVYFIDYQGGRLGPVVYDAVSFLWQAKARFTDAFRRTMLDLYAEELSRLVSAYSKEDILADVDMFALFRTLQVLGAYGFRGLVEKRAHFIESIPYALGNLGELLERKSIEGLPELERVCREICRCRRFAADGHEGLLVKVFSFSYKKGYPEDLTGNGGGFMFDCRGMHNPGRYDEFKPLTGRDRPVIDFLRERGEADAFADRALELVAPTVECYLRRGFSDLQIGFGCTGGRHRSVYCAERVARALAARYPAAKILLIHREQGIREEV